MINRFVSDWETAPETERRKVRRLGLIVLAFILFDIAMIWGLL